MSATDCKSECVFWKLVEERAPRAWGGVGWVAALTLLGKGQQSEQWAGRGGVPRLRWRHYRPKGLRMKTTGHWERVETGRAAFPFPPALQSCPSPLLPLSPATCLPLPSLPQEEQDRGRLTGKAGWVPTTAWLDHRQKGRTLSHFCACAPPPLPTASRHFRGQKRHQHFCAA